MSSFVGERRRIRAWPKDPVPPIIRSRLPVILNLFLSPEIEPDRVYLIWEDSIYCIIGAWKDPKMSSGRCSAKRRDSCQDDQESRMWSKENLGLFVKMVTRFDKV